MAVHFQSDLAAFPAGQHQPAREQPYALTFSWKRTSYQSYFWITMVQYQWPMAIRGDPRCHPTICDSDSSAGRLSGTGFVSDSKLRLSGAKYCSDSLPWWLYN